MEEGVIREGVKESQTIIGGSEEMQAPIEVKMRSNSPKFTQKLPRSKY